MIRAKTLAERGCELGFLLAFPGTIITGIATNSAILSFSFFTVGTGVGLGSSLALHDLQDTESGGEDQR